MEKEIIESIEFQTGAKVDKEKRIVKNVAVLGKTSKNGHEYSDAALEEGRGYFEGSPVFLEHERQKKVKDLAGELRNLHVSEGKLHGDLRVTERHGYILDLAENFPNQLGLSIMATGRVVGARGKEVIEGFAPGKRRSVDLVIGPATLKNLFEQESPKMDEIKELKEQVEKLTTEKAEVEKRLAESTIRVTTDGEKKLLEQMCAIEKKNAELEKALAEQQTAREKAEHGAMIDRKISEAKVEATDAFRMLLEKCTDEKEIDAAIADRKAISPVRHLRSVGVSESVQVPSEEKNKALRESVKNALK